MTSNVFVIKRHLLPFILSAFCLRFGILPAAAINFNLEGTTNYVDSTIQDTRLKVGVDEPHNVLYVTNGGIVTVMEVYVGETSTATNNLLSIMDGGRVIVGNVDTNNMTSGGISVGDADGEGSLIINNASTVDTDYAYLGLGTNETGYIKVSGDGHLNVGEQLVVGSTVNSNNVLDIENGGAAYVDDVSSIVISNISGATNDFNEVNVKSSGQLLIGGDVDATTVIATENLNFDSGAVLGVGGELTIADSAIEDGLNIRLDSALSTNTAYWNSTEIYVGDKTSNNSLTLTNGSLATASDIIYVGNTADSSGNSLNVVGINSVLTALDKLLVGAGGDTNSVHIGDGGSVDIGMDLKLGISDGAELNSVLVDTGGSLNIAQQLIIGAFGSRNTMTVEDGGEVDVQGVLILGENSDNNTLNIYSNNTLFAVHSNVVVGANGDKNSINIQNAPVTFDTNLVIGQIGDSNNVKISGTNAVLTAADLLVGNNGASNYLSIQNGGTVNISDSVVVGQQDDNNYITMNNSNSTFSVANDLMVGQTGDSNKLIVNGGVATIGNNLYLGSETNNAYNTITVSGDSAILAVSNLLYVGSATSSNNTVTVKSGGTLFASGQTNIVMGTATNNLLSVADGGTLKTMGWDFATMTNTTTNIVFQSGSSLHLLGELSGTNKIAGGLGFVLDSTNALWNTGTNNLYVGESDNNNSLTITNGAMAATSNDLYIGSESSHNTVIVGGMDSWLDVGNDLFIGTTEIASTYNTMEVLDGAHVDVGKNAFLYRGANLKIDSTSRMSVAGDYEQDRYSTLEVGISTNQTQPNVTVAGTANLASGGTISIFNDGLGKNDTNVVQTIVVAGKLTIDDQNATTGLLLDRINVETNLLLGFDVTVSNSTAIVLDNFIVRSLGDAADLSGQLLAVSDEINALSAAGNTNAQTMLDILDGLDKTAAKKAMDNFYGEEMSSSPAHNAIKIGMQSVAEQLTMRADTTRLRTGMASTSGDMIGPGGAEGPHTEDQELQGWFAGYGTWFDKKAADGFDAYDGNINGILIGADLSLAEGILVGIAGGSGRSTLDKDNGASIDTKTYYGSIYASAGTKDWFADASIIYGMSKVDSTLGTTFDTKAEYDAQNFALYMGGGKEIDGDYLVYTPQASLLGSYYKQDSYKEKSSNAIGREVDSFDTFYLQSAIGGSIGVYTTMGDLTFKPQVHAFWLHEFNAKEEDISYNLIGSAGHHTMTLQAPEADTIKLGAGVSTKLGEYLELRADLDTRWGSDYSDYTLLGSLRYQF